MQFSPGEKRAFPLHFPIVQVQRKRGMGRHRNPHQLIVASKIRFGACPAGLLAALDAARGLKLAAHTTRLDDRARAASGLIETRRVHAGRQDPFFAVSRALLAAETVRTNADDEDFF
jgi:hypothetical protein